MNQAQQEINSHFERLAAAVRQQEHTDVDFFHMIGEMVSVEPRVGAAFAFHARDILGSSTEDVNYSELVIEVYRRTFFDNEQSKKYNTAYFADDPVMAKNFVDFLLDLESAHTRGSMFVFSAYQFPQ